MLRKLHFFSNFSSLSALFGAFHPFNNPIVVDFRDVLKNSGLKFNQLRFLRFSGFFIPFENKRFPTRFFYLPM